MDQVSANHISGVELEGTIEVDTTHMSSVHGPNGLKSTAVDSDSQLTMVNVTITLTLGSDRGTLDVKSTVNSHRCGATTIRFARGGPRLTEA